MNFKADIEPKLETVENCPLCGHHKTEFLFKAYDRAYRLPGEFGTVKCGGCGLIRLSPRPSAESISNYYPENYGAYTARAATFASNGNGLKARLRSFVRDTVLTSLGYGKATMTQKIARPLLSKLFLKDAAFGYGEHFPPFVENGSALDVGTGNGLVLSHLKNLGWRVQGVDLSPHAAESAKADYDIDVFVGHLQNAPFPLESFDYIHLSHVLEHFFDPVETMRKVESLLKPNGIVLIEVPNAESISARMSGKYWYGWDAPRHLYMFAPETLEKTLNAAGLKSSRMGSVMWDSFYWASVFIKEERTGETLPNRPAVPPEDALKVKLQGFEARLKHALAPKSGDFIRCWATKINS
jgi:2-polyprenyl-3-methyl-5-hydroxy-6-metoxy-1,4-benzoquinol methylase